MSMPQSLVPGTLRDLDPWEARWAPYDEATYAAVLAAIRPDDVVLDIGAGDLRLARRMAQIGPSRSSPGRSSRSCWRRGARERGA